MNNKVDGNKYIITANPNMNGLRLDVCISQQMESVSRNYAQKLITEEMVEVNGVIAKNKKQKVAESDSISVNIPEPVAMDAEPENIPIDIVYEDKDVIVVYKPKGMVVHPAVGNYTGTLVNALMYHCGDSLSSINGTIRPGIVHRIDKNTSGLLMIAKNDKAHESLSRQLQEHSVTREYWGLVYNNIKEDKFTIDKPIGRDEKNRLRKKVNGSGAKNAVTHIEVLERFGKYTLIKAVLETGRTHQIRVHMTYLKHPLIGDEIYGPKKQAFKVDGQILHAKTLGFIHPSTGEYMEFNSDIPEDFSDILEKLRRRKNGEN